MAVVIGLQFFVAGMQSLFDVVLLQDRVLELYLRILFHELLVNRGVANAGASGDEGLQLGQKNVVANCLFEFGGGEISALEHVFIFGLPDEGSAGKEGGSVAAVLQFVFHLFRIHAKTHVLRFTQQGLASDKLLGRTLREERQ